MTVKSEHDIGMINLSDDTPHTFDNWLGRMAMGGTFVGNAEYRLHIFDCEGQTYSLEEFSVSTTNAALTLNEVLTLSKPGQCELKPSDNLSLFEPQLYITPACLVRPYRWFVNN